MESLGTCPLSSIGQSVCLRSKRLGIRIPQGALKPVFTGFCFAPNIENHEFHEKC